MRRCVVFLHCRAHGLSSRLPVRLKYFASGCAIVEYFALGFACFSSLILGLLVGFYLLFSLFCFLSKTAGGHV